MKYLKSKYWKRN